MSEDFDSDDVRLDKWLWAARFFKTRGMAKEAIEGGKVRYDGNPATKSSKVVRVGATLRVRQGYEEVEVKVLALSDRRGPAPQARLLYEETPESVVQRERAKLQRQAAPTHEDSDRPSKQQRRMIQRFKRQMY